MQRGRGVAIKDFSRSKGIVPVHEKKTVSAFVEHYRNALDKYTCSDKSFNEVCYIWNLEFANIEEMKVYHFTFKSLVIFRFLIKILDVCYIKYSYL